VVVLRASDPHAAVDGTAASELLGVIQVPSSGHGTTNTIACNLTLRIRLVSV